MLLHLPTHRIPRQIGTSKDAGRSPLASRLRAVPFQFMQSAQASCFNITYGDAPPPSALERAWRELESRADGSFFTSWTWIGAWLRSLPAALYPRLVQVNLAGEVVGLALFTPCRQRRHGFLRARSLVLNATGDPSYDSIMVEYNGILADRRMQPEVEDAVLNHLLRHSRDSEEIYFDALATPPAVLHRGTDLLLSHRRRTSYHVDLQRVRAQQGGYLTLLGPKSRYKVRRSLRLCEVHGPVELEVADTLPRANEFFARLKVLHAEHWRSRGDEGAFASDFACRFHADLIGSAVADGAVQLLRVKAGGEAVGYLYNFVYRGKVMNYQAGINYTLLPPSESPGLATHALAVDYNAAQGHAVYDFMVGDHQYKRTLSTDTSTQHWVVVRRNLLKFRIEDQLRGLRNRWRGSALKGSTP